MYSCVRYEHLDFFSEQILNREAFHFHKLLILVQWALYSKCSKLIKYVCFISGWYVELSMCVLKKLKWNSLPNLLFLISYQLPLTYEVKYRTSTIFQIHNIDFLPIKAMYLVGSKSNLHFSHFHYILHENYRIVSLQKLVRRVYLSLTAISE